MIASNAFTRCLLLAGALLLGALANGAHALNVGQFIADYRGYYTSSYWIEGDDGLILIDTQFKPSDAVKFLEQAESRTGKKAKLAIIVHPNPDKFNGTEVFQQRGIKVITSEQVKARIPEIHKIRLEWFYKSYQPDYPKEAPSPDVFGSETTRMSVAGVPLTLHVLAGPGCSKTHVIVQAEDHVFVGDLVANGSHSWLEFGFLDEWQARLNEIRAMQPKHVHPGRGKSGGVELLDAQSQYLKRVTDWVVAEKPRGRLGFWTKSKIQSKIFSTYPEYHFTLFVSDALPEVWRVYAEKLDAAQ
jgi:glyoxylase-like metal-dependent hydrolase (beta-lactamase superfamily II)